MSVLVWSNSDILKDYFLNCPLISAWFAKGFCCTWGRFLSEDVKFESILDVHIKNETEKCSLCWECSKMTGRKPSYPWRSWECLEKHPPTLTSLEGLFPGGCCCSHLLHIVPQILSLNQIPLRTGKRDFAIKFYTVASFPLIICVLNVLIFKTARLLILWMRSNLMWNSNKIDYKTHQVWDIWAKLQNKINASCCFS